MPSRPASPLPCWLLALALGLTAPAAPAVDLGPWVRHPQRHDAWTSLDFRHPASGLFLAARAGTEDPATLATLTLTAAPVDGCRAEFVVVFKETPAERDSETRVDAVLRLDGGAPRHLPALRVTQRGDPFVFVRVEEPPGPDALRKHASLAIGLPGGRAAEFSLNGFENAWSAAEGTCRSFAPP